MPFKLRDARGIFHRTMNVIPSVVRWQFALLFLGDIIIFSKSSEKQTLHVRRALTLLTNAAVILKLKRCHLISEIIDSLGHVIRQKRLEIASHTMDAIRKLQPPTSLAGVTLLLRLCNLFQ